MRLPLSNMRSGKFPWTAEKHHNDVWIDPAVYSRAMEKAAIDDDFPDVDERSIHLATICQMVRSKVTEK